MNLLKSRLRIQELMSIFVTQIKSNSAVHRTDLNKISETILIPLFSEVYTFSNLKNLNTPEDPNYPGIDLGDEEAKVAIQVTATADSEKIKHTLKQFIDNKYFKIYDRLIIYILSEKNRSYSGAGFDEILNGKIIFNKETDILDYTDILKLIETFQIGKTTKVQKILEANFGDSSNLLNEDTENQKLEDVFLNLLKIRFPETIYVGQLEEDSINGYSKKSGSKKAKITKREQIQQLLASKGFRFAADWEYYEGKIYTFHNLEDVNNPLRAILDVGTIESLSSDEIYGIDENYEKIFKSLLRRSLQQMLFPRGVSWQNKENLFFFIEQNGGKTRVEKWQGKKANEREVFVKKMKKDKPDEVLIQKHLAFSVQFRQFSNEWFLIITPNWFFSFDGYKKSFYADKQLKWLKSKENNGHVSNHLHFILYFIKQEQKGIFDSSYQKNHFLSFEDYVSFNNAPLLVDKEWNPSKESDTDDNDLIDQQLFEYED